MKRILVRCVSRQKFDDFVKNYMIGKGNFKYIFHANHLEAGEYRFEIVVIPVDCSRRQVEMVLGLRADGCIGFDEEAEEYLCRNGNICKGKTFLDMLKLSGAIKEPEYIFKEK